MRRQKKYVLSSQHLHCNNIILYTLRQVFLGRQMMSKCSLLIISCVLSIFCR